MKESPFEADGESPTVEVRVFRHGAMVHRELVEPEERAMLVLDHWAEDSTG